MPTRRAVALCAAIAATLSAAAATVAAATPQPRHSSERQEIVNAGPIVGAAVRRRGYTCTGPVSATPIADRIVAHEKTWLLHCGTAAYRVTFVLDRQIAIEPLE